jgi:type I restriction enzyme, S subunit
VTETGSAGFTEPRKPTLRSSDVRWLRIDSGHVKRIDRTIADNYRRTYLVGGEVVVTVRGSLGGIALVPPEMAGWNVSREVAVIPVVAQIQSA